MMILANITSILLSDYAPLLMTVGALVAAIIVVTVFATLWAPINRAINGDNRTPRFSQLQIREFQNRPLQIHLKSGVILENAAITGFFNIGVHAPYQMRTLISLALADGTSAYLRIDEVVYFRALDAAKA